LKVEKAPALGKFPRGKSRHKDPNFLVDFKNREKPGMVEHGEGGEGGDRKGTGRS
jgi:hypothetical protein